jgi:hypothetical protein
MAATPATGRPDARRCRARVADQALGQGVAVEAVVVGLERLQVAYLDVRAPRP